jgi:DNA-binding SARP family transcriptional activator
MTEFLILGPMECWSWHKPADISGGLQRTLLAALLAAESMPVSAKALVVELWADSPPTQWENALQAHISRLRKRLKELADDRPARLVGHSSGYRLLVEEDAVDAAVFTRELAVARLLGARDPGRAADKLRAALALWRGSAFGLVVPGPLCRAAALRYETSRVGALETLFDLELRIGRHTEIIPALSELVESTTLNERFCEQLMIALYRSGQQALALETYHRMRTRLDAELGVEPTVTLRNLHKAILMHHPALHLGADHAELRA